MANTILNPSIIAKAAVRILDNELVMASRVYRGYEDEFEKKVNGYDVGDTITIRKPTAFTVRTTITAASPVQDVVEGKLTMTANQIAGVDFQFTSTQLTLNISELADRVIKPAMVRIANQIDATLMAEFYRVPSWVGMPNGATDTPIASFATFARGAERLDQQDCPSDDRSCVLSPESNWALAGSQTGLFLQGVGQPAYRTGEIGTIAGIATYMSQNVPTFTNGTTTGSPLINGGSQNVTYASVLNTESVPGTQTLITDTWGNTLTIPKGTVFTIAGVFAVNPVTKATLPYLQHFTTLTDQTTDGSGNATLTITPAIITSAVPAFQTVSAAPLDNAAITTVGVRGATPSAHRQNLMFHKNAFALAMVPMVKPPGAVDVARESYKGVSVRLIPYYDGANDVSNWRCDVLYAVKTVDPRLAVRVSGGASTI